MSVFRAIKSSCYIASAKTKRDWLIHGHVALDQCNISLGQQVNIVARTYTYK